MLKKSFTILFVPLLSAILFLALGQASWSRTLTVPSGTLMQVTRTMRTGDTLLLASGIHAVKTLFIEQDSITMIGEAGTVIRGERIGQVITVHGNAVSLRNLTIEASGTNPIENDAAIAVYSPNATIFSCTLQEYCHGVYLERADNAIVKGNRFFGRSDQPERENGNSVHLYLTKRAVIEANEFHDGLDGVYFDVCSDGKAIANRASNVRYGIHYMNSHNHVCADNIVTSSFVGVAVMFSKQVTASGNVVWNNLRANAYGILLQDIAQCVVDSNAIVSNETGFLIENVKQSYITRNCIERNHTAMELFSDCSETEISQNDFTGNNALLRMKTIMKSPQFLTRFQNNYWNSLDRTDLDDDGVIDLPMRIDEPFEKTLGEQPLLQLLRDTPAHRLWNLLGSIRPDGVRLLDSMPMRNEYAFISLQSSQPQSHWFAFVSELLLGSGLIILIARWSGNEH